MRRRGFLWLSAVVWVGVAAAATPSWVARRLDSVCEPNQGQTRSDIRFLCRGAGYSMGILSGGADVAVAKSGTPILGMRLGGARAEAKPAGANALAGRGNYLMGADPRQFIRDVPQFGAVRVAEVYRGIDIVYYATGQQVEHDFRIAAYADPEAIRLRYFGMKSLRLENGDLVFDMAGAEIRQKKPLLYQDSASGRKTIDGGYVVAGNEVRFWTGAYDHAHPLIIDPVLVYSTYLGGSGSERECLRRRADYVHELYGGERQATSEWRRHRRVRHQAESVGRDCVFDIRGRDGR